MTVRISVTSERSWIVLKYVKNGNRIKKTQKFCSEQEEKGVSISPGGNGTLTSDAGRKKTVQIIDSLSEQESWVDWKGGNKLGQRDIETQIK